MVKSTALAVSSMGQLVIAGFAGQFPPTFFLDGGPMLRPSRVADKPATVKTLLA